MKSFKITGEKLVNLFLLCVSGFYLAYSLTHYKLGTPRSPKEGFMPLILGVGMTALSGFLTVQAFLDKGDAKNVRFHISWKRFAAIVAVSLLYALSMEALGYMPASFLFLLFILKLAGVAGWKKPVLISLVCAGGFYLLFKVALGVMLPAGFIGL